MLLGKLQSYEWLMFVLLLFCLIMCLSVHSMISLFTHLLQIICIWSRWCNCHPVICCFIKIQNGLPFLCQLTQVVLEKRPLSECCSLFTRPVQPVATCRQSPYLHKPAIVKLLLFIYSFQFRSAFRATTTPSQPRPLQSVTHSWTHVWC